MYCISLTSDTKKKSLSCYTLCNTTYFEQIVHYQRGQLWYAYLYIKQNKCRKKSDAPSGIWTHDTPISWQVLQPLSYRGNHSGVSQILATKETSITRHLLQSFMVFMGESWPRSFVRASLHSVCTQYDLGQDSPILTFCSVNKSKLFHQLSYLNLFFRCEILCEVWSFSTEIACIASVFCFEVVLRIILLEQ